MFSDPREEWMLSCDFDFVVFFSGKSNGFELSIESALSGSNTSIVLVSIPVE